MVPHVMETSEPWQVIPVADPTKNFFSSLANYFFCFFAVKLACMFVTYRDNSLIMKWPSLTSKIGKRRKKFKRSATGLVKYLPYTQTLTVLEFFWHVLI